jgi:hypothetical protein|tara:strand:- start:408 stop:710 length:303 start_codon:yes stop_codon:yes gene_type:complete
MFKQVGQKILMGGKRLGTKIKEGSSWIGKKIYDNRKEIALGLLAVAGSGLLGKDTAEATKSAVGVAKDPAGSLIRAAPDIRDTAIKLATRDTNRPLFYGI